MKTPTINVTQPAEPIPAEIIASAIVAIAEGMRKLNASRLRRDAIVILIQSKSGICRRDIELVLNNLEQLESVWLKPAPRPAGK